MAYQALYRRLRPRRFEDVVGQEHIVRTLKNQIEQGRINHAYLFCGTRGTGKTTTAKIFARAINCISEEETKPCNKCDVCQSILKDTNVNVVEIDAASNNGVENVRTIIDEVKYPPTDCKYKVYIIDEVHMLSASAFNALLKTLEEPPEYAVFILATTDPQKMPVTVLSRCQRFDFHRISKDDMTSVLKEYIVSEGADVTDEAVEYIAEVSDGAMRDALSILDQCISFYFDRQVTDKEVREVVGAVDTSVFFELINAINDGNCGQCMDIIDRIVLQGRDILQFVNDIITHLRNLLLAISIGRECRALDYSKAYIDKLASQGNAVGYDYLISLINSFSQLSSAVKYSFNPRILLEVCVIKACNPVIDYDLGSVDKRLKEIENKIEKGMPVQKMTDAKPEEKKLADEKSEEAPAVIEKAVPEDIKNVINNWKKFVKSLDKGMLRAILATVKPAYIDEDFLTIVCINNGPRINVENHISEVKELLKNFFDREFNVKTMTEEQYNIRHIEKYGAKDENIKVLTKDDFTRVFGDIVTFE